MFFGSGGFLRSTYIVRLIEFVALASFCSLLLGAFSSPSQCLMTRATLLQALQDVFSLSYVHTVYASYVRLYFDSLSDLLLSFPALLWRN